MNHELKIWPQYFEPLLDGAKDFEIRRNDRNYQIGDVLQLREYLRKEGTYTGRELTKKVKYISDYPVGLQPGFVVLGLEAKP